MAGWEPSTVGDCRCKGPLEEKPGASEWVGGVPVTTFCPCSFPCRPWVTSHSPLGRATLRVFEEPASRMWGEACGNAQREAVTHTLNARKHQLIAEYQRATAIGAVAYGVEESKKENARKQREAAEDAARAKAETLPKEDTVKMLVQSCFDKMWKEREHGIPRQHHKDAGRGTRSQGKPQQRTDTSPHIREAGSSKTRKVSLPSGERDVTHGRQGNEQGRNVVTGTPPTHSDAPGFSSRGPLHRQSPTVLGSQPAMTGRGGQRQSRGNGQPPRSNRTGQAAEGARLHHDLLQQPNNASQLRTRNHLHLPEDKRCSPHSTTTTPHSTNEPNAMAWEETCLHSNARTLQLRQCLWTEKARQKFLATLDCPT
ncbi:hypothetical protein SELMODRAFT_426282 [Selaginella moellendorffii]|uniref:Uncharacterized protein n=1 Tax=Selaginella moellendorffii TaxID=88036 RepID=D8SVX1_SELML|nr:hypothetical protein SELMODRAFT_426282 [Selaginella moellendorffii]